MDNNPGEIQRNIFPREGNDSAIGTLRLIGHMPPLALNTHLNFVNHKSGNHTDSINSLLYLAIEHMLKECKVTENNGACQSLFVLFIEGRYLAWFIHCKHSNTYFTIKFFMSKCFLFNWKLFTKMKQIGYASKAGHV